MAQAGQELDIFLPLASQELGLWAGTRPGFDCHVKPEMEQWRTVEKLCTACGTGSQLIKDMLQGWCSGLSHRAPV